MNRQTPAWIVVLAIGSMALSGTAKAADTATQASTTTNSGGFLEQVQSTLSGIKQSIDGVFESLGSIGASLSEKIGELQVPDIGSVVEDILQGNSTKDEGTRTAEAIEGDGYSTRADQAQTAIREAATATAQSSVLSQQAQRNLRQKLEENATNAQQIVQLGDDSQNTDVTQHILQNVSQQLAMQANLQQTLVEQGITSSTNDALQTAVLSQVAQEAAATNLAKRRENAAVTTQSITNRGMMMMPGGHTLSGQTDNDR